MKILLKPLKDQQEELPRVSIIAEVNRGLQNLKSHHNTIQNLIKQRDKLLEQEEHQFQRIKEINALIKEIIREKKENPEYFQEDIKQQTEEEVM